MSCVLTNTSISKSVIVFNSSPVLTSQLYALYKLAVNIIFATLSLILDCPSLELTITVYRGLFIGCPLPYISCDPCVPIQSSNTTRRRFWPIKAWDGWPSPLVLKIGNAKKVPISP